MKMEDYKNIVLNDFYLNNSISSDEKYHNIKTWLRYNLFPCKDADSVLKEKKLPQKLNWPYDFPNIYLDCIFSMKTYFNMFLRMYNIKASKSYAWLLIYFDEIFSDEKINLFCKKNKTDYNNFKECLDNINNFAYYTHTIGNYMTCPDNKYNDLKGYSGFLMFNDRIEILLNVLISPINKDVYQFIGSDRYKNWQNWFEKNIISLSLNTLFVNDKFVNLKDAKIKPELLAFALHNEKRTKSYKFDPSEIQAYSSYLNVVNTWIDSRTNNLVPK